MLNKIERLLRVLGAQLIEWRTNNEITHGVWNGAQLKTEADRLAHTILSTGLTDISPTIPVISEEDVRGQVLTRPHRYWLIDPIDGTASYAGQFPGFVTQVALIEGGKPTLAAVYAPATDVMYTATAGSGSTMNGRRLKAQQSGDAKCLIDNYPEPRGTAAAAFHGLGFGRYVESGSIALKICRIADGSADLFFKDVVVRDWDIAAAGLVLMEAGGVLCDLTGQRYEFSGSYEKSGIVASSNLSMANEFVGWLRQYKERESDAQAT